MTADQATSGIVLVSELSGPTVAVLRDRIPDARLVWVDPQRLETTHLDAIFHLEVPVYADHAVRGTLLRQGSGELRELGELLSANDAPPPEWRARARRAARSGPVVFCPSNDTHVKMFAPIARHLPGARFLVADHRPEERARATLDALGLAYAIGGPGTLARMFPAAVVVGNDWYGVPHELFRGVRPRGVPTVCIQEGCLDFARERRMQFCDYPLIQGLIVLNHLPQRIYLPTGNPRFDKLYPAPSPPAPKVMINSNFTYGIHEDVRDAWVRDVAGSCARLGVPSFVSQHPRDTGAFPDLEVRASGATVVHEHVREATVVATRFSTLVYEALHLGRPVVYYNPHGEDMRLFNEDQTGALLVARNTAELDQALSDALEPPTSQRRAAVELFLDLHCGPRDGLAAQRCASALAAIARRGDVAESPSLRARLHAYSMLVR